MEKKKLVEGKLRERLEFEQENYFFTCKNCVDNKIKYNFEDAFEMNFRCPECGGSLEAQDNDKLIQFLKEKIARLEKSNLTVDSTK